MKKLILLFLFQINLICFGQELSFDNLPINDTIVFSNSLKGGKNKLDTISYSKLNCGLFISSQNKVAFQTISIIRINPPKDAIRYIEWVFDTTNINQTPNGMVSLTSIVDTNSFKFLKSNYWKDKNNVYWHTPTSDGGTVTRIYNANSAGFNVYKDASPYACDLSNVFYKSKLLVNADIETFEVIFLDGIPELAKDKNGYYYSGEFITITELEKLKQ